MTQVCHCCTLARRLELDRQIVEGKNLAKLAKEFDVPYHSIYSHSRSHISRQLATVMENKQLAVGEELLETINKIITRAERIFKRNYIAKKDLLALKALDSQRNTIQLLSNIAAQLHSARVLELQLAKDSGEDKEAQLQQEYQEKIAILSLEELFVYQRLVNKITNQNADIIISNDKVLKHNCNGNKND